MSGIRVQAPVTRDGSAGRPGDDPGDAAAGGASLRRRLRLSGAAVLLAGLAAAALAYRTAAPDDDRLLIARLNNTKRYEYQMEEMGGKANLLATELKDGFLGLWRGKGLPRTLLVLSGAVSLACFYVAHRLGHVERRARAAPGARG